MKKVLSILLVSLLVLALVVGCAQSNDVKEPDETPDETPSETPDETPAEEPEEDIVIGATLLNVANEYIYLIQVGLEKAAEELGVKVIINDGERDADKQIQQVESFIAQGVDGIVVNPGEAEAVSPAIDKAKEAGVPIVNVCTVTVSEPDSFIGSRDEESAEIAINYIAERIGGKGNILMMRGYPGQSSEIKRTEGAMEALKAYPDIKLLTEQTANWSREEAMSLMENWLQAYEGQIDAVFCQNDEMAMGALKALEDAGVKDKVVLIGIDAIADALQAVKDGRLDATVFQDASGQGYKSLETVMKIIKGESFDKEVMIPFQLVTADNVDSFMN